MADTGKPIDTSHHLDPAKPELQDKAKDAAADGGERADEVNEARLKQLGEATRNGSVHELTNPAGAIVLTEIQELKADVRTIGILLNVLFIGAAAFALGYWLLRRGGTDVE